MKEDTFLYKARNSFFLQAIFHDDTYHKDVVISTGAQNLRVRFFFDALRLYVDMPSEMRSQ